MSKKTLYAIETAICWITYLCTAAQICKKLHEIIIHDGVEIEKDRALWQKIYKIIADSSDRTGIFGSGKVKVKFPGIWIKYLLSLA